MKKIIVTGGSGRFGQVLKKHKTKFNIIFPSKLELNILNEKNIQKYFKSKRPNYVIHLAGLSRPMDIHQKNIKKSIDLNIIGTANITKMCENIFQLIIFILVLKEIIVRKIQFCL